MRHLGSFNHNIDPTGHPNDWSKKIAPVVARPDDPRLGYTLGINRDVVPFEYPLASSTGPGMTGAPKRVRMAGEALYQDITLSPGTPAAVPLPKVGTAELRVPDLYSLI